MIFAGSLIPAFAFYIFNYYFIGLSRFPTYVIAVLICLVPVIIYSVFRNRSYNQFRRRARILKDQREQRMKIFGNNAEETKIEISQKSIKK